MIRLRQRSLFRARGLRRDRAFSLAEAAIAVLIFTVGMAGVLDLLANSRRIDQLSLWRLRATALADGKLAVLQAAGCEALIADEARGAARQLPVAAPADIDGAFPLAWQVAVQPAPGLDDVCRVSIAVSWSRGDNKGFAAPVGERVVLTGLVVATPSVQGGAQ